MRQNKEAATMKPAAEPLAVGPLMLELAVAVTALAGLIVSARFVVAEAIWLAELFALPDNLIGLSLVAIGTSLPELMVSVTAARKGKAALIVGNIMGSNIANILLIVGMAGSINPVDVAELSVVYTIPIMLFFSLALLYFVRSDWRITRAQGITASGAYAAFLATAFWQGSRVRLTRSPTSQRSSRAAFHFIVSSRRSSVCQQPWMSPMANCQSLSALRSSASFAAWAGSSARLFTSWGSASRS